ncbi:MAG TPA: hypothetical protein VNN72_27710 [Polyangiaceae bacterium]|nr:hypothetical protein [Polyangiaceae bacterium]
MKRAFLTAALLLVSGLLSAPARAGDAAAAEALFREGRQLMDAGDYARACPKLAESYEQEPGTGTLLALAMCREKEGKLASAWAAYGQVASRSKRDGRADREQVAREQVAALEPRLSRLTINVDAGTAVLGGLAVKRDGSLVGSGAWGTAVPLDPGEHQLEATAPGKKPWTAKVTIGAERDTQTVTVPVLDVDEQAVAGAAPLGGSPADTPAEQTGASKGPPLRTIGLIVGGVGIVGLGVGGVFALQANSANKESKEDGHCDAQNQCDTVGGEKRDDAKSAASVATVMFITGGVLTAAGVTLFLVGSPKRKSSGALVQATPVLGRNDAGLVVRGSF